MKIKNGLSLFAIILALCSLPLQSFALWEKMPGSATDIGANGHAPWVTGTSPTNGGYKIYRWGFNDWELIPGGAVSLAVGSNNKAWVVNNNGEIFYKSFDWHKLPGSARDIGVGGPDKVWVIGTDRTAGGYQIFNWNGANWDRVEGGGVRIAVDPLGNPWVVNDQGEIFYLLNGRWQRLPGRGTDIAIGRNGIVWLIGADKKPGGYGIYRWTGGNWELVDGAGVRIAVDGSGYPWVINENGEIFKYHPEYKQHRVKHHEYRISF